MRKFEPDQKVMIVGMLLNDKRRDIPAIVIRNHYNPVSKQKNVEVRMNGDAYVFKEEMLVSEEEYKAMKEKEKKS